MLHNPITYLPSNVIVDTNVLLDATFVDGLARKAIKTVKSSRFKLITNEQSIFDGHLRLQNLKKELNLKFDPLPYFELFLIQNKIHIVPNENNYKEYDDSSINNSDKHLIPVIKKYEGWLLTSDLTLICAKLPHASLGLRSG